jgi:serine/threonine-protein kinase HipA
MGTLNVTPLRGKELFSFEYNHDWLKAPYSCVLDPSLQLLEGVHYAPSEQENFGVFLDSSPDRWGRLLMKRREAQQARKENRAERKLLESDYLLGVYDEHRMGALRFRTNPKGPFLDNNQKLASPPWAKLQELENACLEIEKKGAEEKSDYSRWLEMLIAPGGSLGGARPKASVIDKNKQLWIAKFPRISDSYDVGAWEMVAYKLAQQANINMSNAKLRKFNSNYHTFLSKRFDRDELGDRIHFASAMTMLQRSDGDDSSTGASYLELVEFIIRHGAQTDEDLEQLWRRIVFYICISNTDDHLRNHGFILEQNGWVLSPAYDINPVPDSNGLKLNISESDNAQDLELAKEVAPYFRLTVGKVGAIIQEVTEAVKGWKSVADTLGISKSEQEMMKRAFRVVETDS